MDWILKSGNNFFIPHATGLTLFSFCAARPFARCRPQSIAHLLHKHLVLEPSQEKINVANWASCPTEQQPTPCLSRLMTLTPWRTTTQQKMKFPSHSFTSILIAGFFWPPWRSCHRTPSTFCSNPLALWVSYSVCVRTFCRSNKSGDTLFVPH